MLHIFCWISLVSRKAQLWVLFWSLSLSTGFLKPLLCWWHSTHSLHSSLASAQISECLADILSCITIEYQKVHPSKTELMSMPRDESMHLPGKVIPSGQYIQPWACPPHNTNMTWSCRILPATSRRSQHLHPFRQFRYLFIGRVDYCHSTPLQCHCQGNCPTFWQEGE